MSTQTHVTDASLLGLSSVLVGSLPATLLTTAAPDRYTVEAVFTRRPAPDEVAEIIGEATQHGLSRAGYPRVTLSVADRRLVIHDTTLEELRDGLADALSSRLSEISTHLRRAQEATATALQGVADREAERAAAVAALAESVTFTAHPHDGDNPETADQAPSDDAQVSSWDSEGGHERTPRREEPIVP